MNRINRLYLIAVVAAASGCGTETETAAPEPLNTDRQRFSYAIGYQLGQDVGGRGLDVDPAALAQAVRDGLTAAEPRLSREEMQAAVVKRLQNQMEGRRQLADENREKGKTFLSQNKLKEGVVETSSGLQYRVMEPGGGQKPTADSQVTVHYRGTLLDGTEFDSSLSRGEPTSLQVNQVIPGWQEALQLMAEGAKWKVFVPSDLAYGERGAGDAIGPGETLIFEIELISVDARSPQSES